MKPRWLALLVVVLVLASGMAWLGQWQLDRARQNDAGQRQEDTLASATPRPLESVIKPRQTFPKDVVGVRVTATGTWDGGRRLLVADRELAGRKGYWVLVPLLLDDGSAVPVVRGWVASPDDPAASTATDQQVTVTGLLQPSEPAATDRAPGQSTGLPDGQIDLVSMPDLIDAWTYPLITGFVVQQSQQPATGVVPAAVPPPPAPQGYNWRNLSYAVQWWLFAGFGLFFWYRLVRDDHRGLLTPAPRETDTVQP